MTRYPAAEALARSVPLPDGDGIKLALVVWSVEYEACFRCAPDPAMVAAASKVLVTRLAKRRDEVPELPPSASGTWSTPPGLLLMADLLCEEDEQ